jgi:hypothetical protein
MTPQLDEKAILAEIFDSGTEQADPRVRYVTIQVDRRTWASLVHFRDDGAPTPTLLDWRLRDTIELDDLFDADRHALVLDWQAETRRMHARGITAFPIPRGREIILIEDLTGTRRPGTRD